MKRVLLLLLISTFSLGIFSQNQEILITIGRNKITADEFSHIYKKNNSIAGNENSVKDYLDLFINFKLKVYEAESLKMDTSTNFKNELAGYRDQLSKPYMTENVKKLELIKEQYERSKEELKLDLILIAVPANAENEKWDVALQKAKKIKQRIISGEEFEKVAKETSDDKSVVSNGGHLPFFPALRIPYSIQKYAFSAKINELSEPIKTSYGYYIVRVAGKRPAKGSVKVAHIMIRNPKDLTESQKLKNKNKIDSIYNRLKAGDDFNSLLKFSDDKSTAEQGGELPWFNTGRMVPEFENAAFSIKNINEYSKPVETNFGWHIIKLLDKKAPDSYEAQKLDIEKKNNLDKEMLDLIKQYVVEKLSKEFEFKENSKPEAIYNMVDSSIFKAKWTFEGVPEDQNKFLFKIKGIKYDENDFGNFILNKQTKRRPIQINLLVDELYNEFIYESLVEVEKDGLEDKHPEFKNLMQEYHDGILLFDITKIRVWDKASNDSLGLEKFYNENIDDYKNDLQIDISIFKYADKKYAEKAEKVFLKDRKNYTDEKIIEEVADNDINKLSKIGGGLYSRNQNMHADRILDMIKNNEINENTSVAYLDNDILIFINKRIISKGKEFKEIKGIVIADYQNFLEKIWIDQLKAKYTVKVNNKVLDNIKL